VTAGAYVDDGKSAMANTNPVLNVLRLTGSLVSLNAARAILGQKILMDVLLQIYERNAFIVRTSMAHSSKTSTKLSRVRPICLKDVISSYSAHCLTYRSELKQQTGKFPIACGPEINQYPEACGGQALWSELKTIPIGTLMAQWFFHPSGSDFTAVVIPNQRGISTS